MQINIKNFKIQKRDKIEIERLLREPQNSRTDLEQMWFLMDKVWDEYGCDNINLNWDKIEKFYSHPVWLLNGLFIEQHSLSKRHRELISDWVVTKNFNHIVDYGGGHGTLAKLIATKDDHCKIDIYEPHPSKFALQEIKPFSNINIINSIDADNYDCLISTDVLEHVPNPLETFSNMEKSVVKNGYLVLANNFSSVIKCHLPRTFHLRYTFNLFAKLMGLKKMGEVDGSHATIFKKKHKNGYNPIKIKKYEQLSKFCFPFLCAINPVVRHFKGILE